MLSSDVNKLSDLIVFGAVKFYLHHRNDKNVINVKHKLITVIKQ